MTESERTGGKGVGAIVATLGLVAAVAFVALALDSGTPAGASGLQQFSSCAELEAWTSDQQEIAIESGVDDAIAGRAEAGDGAVSSGAPAASPLAPSAAEEASGSGASATADFDQSGAGTGGTNTVVEGVDEIDVIDRVSADRLLVARNGALALVDLTGRTVVAELSGLPYDARVSAADGLVWVAGSSADGLGTEVRRVRIDGDALVEEGSWSTPGYLLDARRSGDRLHVVAVDHPQLGAVPFEGGPVPCDQVWRPVDPATTASATLVATLSATGAVQPTAVAEITGSAGNLLVTDDAVYVATESWTDGGEITTGLHRLDGATLAPTGSGAVAGSLAGPFAINEHDGHLRVATSRSGGGFIGGPMPVEGDAVGGGVMVDEVAPAPAVAAVESSAAAPEQEPVDESTTTTVAETTTVPESSTTTVPETTTTVPDTTTTTEVTTTTVPETTTTTVPDEAPEDALAEVFVLDTDGDLDVIGRSGRFGHDFETIFGVRFVGETAYVVTFRQTDPFWVIDLSDPAAPTVVGQLQIPGFSGYLHPAGDGRVIGFGPDGSGSVAARLFDVADPQAPAVLDEIRLGDDSPVAYDHHAFVGLDGGRFAVPVTDYPDYLPQPDCVPQPEPVPLPDPVPLPVEPDAGTGGGASGSTGIAVGEPVPECEFVPVGGATGAVVLEVAGGRLSVVERATIETAEHFAERIVQAPGGAWLALSWDRLLATDGSGDIALPTA